MKAGFEYVGEQMDRKFDAVHERFDRMYRVMIWFCGLAMATLISAVASLLAAQL